MWNWDMPSLKKIRFIKSIFGDALTYMEKGDAVQSSEKLYKVAEECVKVLSECFKLEEVKMAEEKGRWTVRLLEKAVGKLADKLGLDVGIGWDAASYLHVWGFHETKLDLEDVKRRTPLIKRLIELTEKTCY